MVLKVILALVMAAIALFLPGKRHFIAGRRKAFATLVKKLLTEPLRTALEGYVREKDCQEIETTLREFETAAIKLTSNNTRELQRKEGVKKLQAPLKPPAHKTKASVVGANSQRLRRPEKEASRKPP